MRDAPLETFANTIHTTIESNDTDLIIVVECKDGPFDGRCFGLPYTKEQCAKMWPALKAFAESSR